MPMRMTLKAIKTAGTHRNIRNQTLPKAHPWSTWAWGLHPSIRNIRKSVAKGLVSLQETLDSITFKNSELKESDISKHDGEISKRASAEERQAGEEKSEQDTTSPCHMKSGVMELCQDQPHALMDVNISSVDIEKSELLSGTDEIGKVSEETEHDSSGYVEPRRQHLQPLIQAKELSELHGVCEDNDSFLVDSERSSKEDEVAGMNAVVPPRELEQNSNALVSGEGLQIDGGRCIVESGQVELIQESGVISLGNKATETSAKEQRHTKSFAESLKSSDLEDNIPAAVCSESSSELKDNISAGGDSERDQELGGDDMLGMEIVEASFKKHVNNIKGEANVCVVKGNGKLIDDRWTTEVEVDTKEISDIKEVANACEVEGEGDDKPVDDMHSVGVENKGTHDIIEALNVFEVEGDYKLVDDMQTADTIGLVQRETPGVDEFGKDVGPVEDIGSMGSCGSELEDLSKVTSDLQGKQQKPKDTVSGKEVHMEEIANCSSEQKMAVNEDGEMWEDKFDNKEISQKHNDGNIECGDIIDLPRDEDLVEEEVTTEKVNKQPCGEFLNGEGDLAEEELIVEEPRKESDKELIEEKERN